MNDPNNDQLSRSIREALGDIIADSPRPAPRPVQVIKLRSNKEPAGPRRLILAVAAATIIVAGGVAIANRSDNPTTVGVGGTNETTDSATAPTPTTVSGPVSPPPADATLASLLYPVGATNLTASIVSMDATWVANARSFVTPDGKVLSALLEPPHNDIAGAAVDERALGTNTVYFLNEDGNHVYLATGNCQSVAVLAPNEYGGQPWSAEALALAATIDVNSGDAWVSAPAGWSTIDGGFAELVYDINFGVTDPAGGLATTVNLQQASAPLGYLIAQSGMPFMNAEAVTMTGLPSATDDNAWVLSDATGRQYVGWNTSFGSALLVVQSDQVPAEADILRMALQIGYADRWSAALANGGTPSPSVGAPVGTATTAVVGTAPTTVAIVTTSIMSAQSTPAACTTPENG